MTRGDALSAQERAYQYTKEAVLTGTFAGGELITEGQVADALRMSRTPVREAFLRLEAEGLLRLYPKRGALVVPVSAREVEAVLEARELVEGHALRKVLARSAASRAPVVERLRELVAEQRRRLETGDERAFAHADREFHRLIVAEAGNPILLELYETLRDRQLRMVIGTLNQDRERARHILAEHGALVDALESGDAAALADQLRRHLDRTRAMLH